MGMGDEKLFEPKSSLGSQPEDKRCYSVNDTLTAVSIETPVFVCISPTFLAPRVYNTYLCKGARHYHYHYYYRAGARCRTSSRRMLDRQASCCTPNDAS
jgi:hypothetical protein